uniref:Putative secreted peptide n=1 Tax=Anopheles braziliensis TaxID=58242 RepID=A0A2M3ZUZ2_9DIPT
MRITTMLRTASTRTSWRRTICSLGLSLAASAAERAGSILKSARRNCSNSCESREAYHCRTTNSTMYIPSTRSTHLAPRSNRPMSCCLAIRSSSP